MLKQNGYFFIFREPAIFSIGIITFLSFCFTALIAILNAKGINKIPFRWHPRMAAASIILAFIHGLIVVFAYFL